MERNLIYNIHLFESLGKYYLFDVNTDRIVALDKETYFCLKTGKVETDYQNDKIISLEKDGLLKKRWVEETEHPLTEYAGFYLSGKLCRMTFQITQDCNLRCDYCIYSGDYQNRTHSKLEMDFETVKKGLDYLLAHSCQSKNILIGFYGGEPLLKFDLIKKSVAYADKLFEGKPVSYQITSNITLLTEEMMDFLVEHGFNVLFSFDGPEEIHDKNRKFKGNGKGTFGVVIPKLYEFKNKYPDFFETNVSVNTVLDSENSFLAVDRYFRSQDLFLDKQISSNMVDMKYRKITKKTNGKFYEEYNYELFKTFLLRLGWLHNYKESVLLKEKMFQIVKSRVGKENGTRREVPLKSHRSGPCIPGIDRLFVTAEGKLYPCERVSESSCATCIGSIESGIDLLAVQRLMNIEKLSSEKCRKCWAYFNCLVCASFLDDVETGSLSAKGMEESCHTCKEIIEDNFKNYLFLESHGYNFLENQRRRCFICGISQGLGIRWFEN